MSNIKIKTTWDLSPFFKSDDDPSMESKRKEWISTTEKFIAKWKNNNDYLTSPQVMKEALDDYEKLNRFYGGEADEVCYFWLRTNADQSDAKAKGGLSKAQELSKELDNKIL